MLKLSNKGLYGIKALYELASHYGGEPVAIREMSKRHGMPAPFLEQVLHHLKKEGLVKSKRGAAGGYILSREPGKITLGDAVRALEGPIALCECLQSHSKNKQEKASQCITSGIYRRIGTAVEDAFDSVTLYDLATEGHEKTMLAVCGGDT
jgi:Rrf2 family protein